MEWVGLILEILLLGIFLIWEGYNKKKGENLAMKEDARNIAYENEKGKNLATKEDIESITKEIKSIEAQFTNKTELLKSKLSLLNNIKQEIFLTEKNIVIEVNKKIYGLNSFLKKSPIINNRNDINLYRNKVENLLSDEESYIALLYLFVNNKKLFYKAEKISQDLYIISVKHILDLFDIENKMLGFEAIQNNYKKDILKEIDKIENEIDSLVLDFMSDCKDYLYTEYLDKKPET